MAVHKRVAELFLMTALVIGPMGCGSSDSGGGPSMDEVAAQLDAQNTTEQQQAQAEAERKAKEAEQAAANAAPAEQERKVAGREAVGEGGYYTAIVGARRHVLNKVEGLPWKQAVQHFQATEGRLPKDHDEFMNKVVRPLEIDLGFKEEDQEFLYDPTPTEEEPWGTVYVVQKEPAPAP